MSSTARWTQSTGRIAGFNENKLHQSRPRLYFTSRAKIRQTILSRASRCEVRQCGISWSSCFRLSPFQEMKSWVAARHLYVHFPLCRIKCSYCAFNVTTSDDPRWRSGFSKGILSSLALQQPQEASFDTVYFGGGTPSLASRRELLEILESVPRSDDAEMTVEVNPTLSKNGVSIAELRDLGFTRLSLGLQSLDDKALKFSKSVSMCLFSLCSFSFSSAARAQRSSRPGCSRGSCNSDEARTSECGRDCRASSFVERAKRFEQGPRAADGHCRPRVGLRADGGAGNTAGQERGSGRSGHALFREKRRRGNRCSLSPTFQTDHLKTVAAGCRDSCSTRYCVDNHFCLLCLKPFFCCCKGLNATRFRTLRGSTGARATTRLCGAARCMPESGQASKKFNVSSLSLA